MSIFVTKLRYHNATKSEVYFCLESFMYCQTTNLSLMMVKIKRRLLIIKKTYNYEME